MRRHGTLRVAGGARGVEDRDVVVGIDLDVGQRRARREQVFQCDDLERVVGPGLGVFADGDDLGGDRSGFGRTHPVQSVGVGDHDLRAGVVEREHHLVGLPPGVHRDGDRTHRGDRGEGSDPLRVVAHGDRHPVAVGDAEVVHEGVADLADQLEHPRHRPALVLEDDEVVGASGGGSEQMAHVRRRSGEHLGRHTEDVDLLDLEPCTWRAHLRARFLECHRHGCPS